jgi:hypothetical protein
MAFLPRGHDPKEDLKWVLMGGRILTLLAEAVDRLDACCRGLSESGSQDGSSKPLG